MTDSELKALLTSLVVDYKHAKATLRQERIKLKEAKAHEGVVLSAQRLAQEAASQIQQRVHEHVATIVTRCIQAVFPEPYGFEILFTKKRGKTEAEMKFTLDGNRIDPMEQSGGGLLDVAALALQVAKLTMDRPPHRLFLGLDEPFKWIDKANLPRVAELLLALAEDMKIQIVMVTHIEELMVGKVVKL